MKCPNAAGPERLQMAESVNPMPRHRAAVPGNAAGHTVPRTAFKNMLVARGLKLDGLFSVALAYPRAALSQRLLLVNRSLLPLARETRTRR